MVKFKKIIAAAAAAATMGVIGLTAFAAAPLYINFSIYGNDCTGIYQFSDAGYKDTVWAQPSRVHVYKGNVSSTNRAYISVYSYDFPDYPSGRISTGQTVDHLTSAGSLPYTLYYDTDCIDDLSRKTVYLCAESGDDYVTLEGEWIP